MGSAPGSSTSVHRPSITIVLPPQTPRIQTLEPAFTRRSYSADHLQVAEPEIMVTSPGGTSSTESHVMSLQRALSDLVESQGREEEDEDEGEGQDEGGDGPITMRNSTASSSTSAPPGTPPQRTGISKSPTVVVDLLDPERAGLSTALTHGIGGSEITLAPSTGVLEQELLESKNKKKASNRMSRIFNRDASMNSQQGRPNPTTNIATTDLSRQPSKAGVLSNLLKLQSSKRHHKVCVLEKHKLSWGAGPSEQFIDKVSSLFLLQQHGSRPKEKKEKKAKSSAFYNRSANHSTASLTTKSVFGTYPPLPETLPTQGTSIGLSNFQPNRNSRPLSMQFDSYFAQPFSAMNSPFQSPSASRRGSLSGENSPNGGFFGFGAGSSGSATRRGSLSNEEQMRITMAVADILERQDYILRLAKAMIKYGSPSHRLEDAIDHSAKALELNVQCVYLPNVMIVAFTDYETHTSETHLLKVSAGLDMYKCALVHKVHKMVTHSSMPVEEAIMKLDAINTEKDVNPRWLTILAYATASFCTAPMFFKGSWIDAGVSFLIGGAVGLMVWLSEKVPSYAHICDVTMSLVVAFVAEALQHSNVCQSAVKLAGIVILLPGYTITCAILELSSRHIISGSVRLFFAVIFSLLLGYGLTIGASIWTLFDHTSTDSGPNQCSAPPLDPKWNILFVPLFAISLNIWLKAHPRQWPLATVLSIVGFVVSYVCSTYAGATTDVSSALAAFAIGLLGNIYQRWTKQLSFQAVVCAVFFLVPGSMGLKGAMSMFTDDMTGGINFAIQMVITAIAISVGLFASALVVYPMGKTRSAQMTF
ncbi:hypothetical protein BGZ58_005645 [Dissophora ornata]|nr:hypothetical protein BGZ58_005645 [Dissophora ornata]